MAILTEKYRVHEAELPQPIITSITPSHLIPGERQEVTVIGNYLNEHTWIEIQDCTTIQCNSGNNKVIATIDCPELSESFTLGFLDISIFRQRGDKNTFDSLISIIDPTIVPNVDSKGWLELSNSFSYTTGTSSSDQIQRSSGARIVQNSEGLYTDRRGWIRFNILRWDRLVNTIPITRTVDFILYLRGNRYFTLGLMNEDYNIRSTDPRGAVAAFRFDRNTIKYLYGNGLRNFILEEELKTSQYYRFRISNNAKKRELAQLFLLASADKADWNDGELVWEKPISLNLDESGDSLIPVLFEINRDNPILAVRAF